MGSRLCSVHKVFDKMFLQVKHQIFEKFLLDNIKPMIGSSEMRVFHF
jgi:hypothetical protein